MRKLLFVLVLTIAVGGLLFAADVPGEKDVIKKETKKGTVTFVHSKHLKVEGVTCITCHHTFEEGKAIVACGACHGVKEDVSKSMKAFHKLCKNCHKKNKDKKAPTKCKECHIKA
jgi:hypothetical protein